MSRKILLYGTICLLSLLPILAQLAPKDVPAIELAMKAKDYRKADSILKSEVDAFIALGNLDTVIHFIPIAGEIADAKAGPTEASKVVFAQIEILKSKNARPATLVRACKIAADFFSSLGSNQDGYRVSEDALKYTLSDPNHTDLEVARCQYNLGTYAYRLADISRSKVHHLQSLEIRLANKNTEPEDFYFSYNAVGSLFWNASKYDSAILYYNNALDALKKMPANELNQYYRPGNILNNMSAVYSATGKTTEALHALESTIDNFQKYIATGEDGAKKQSATEGLFEGIDNLAAIYKEVGDFGKAGDLLRYSYQQKLQKLKPNHAGIFISQILIGQHYHAVHEYDSSMFYLRQGLDRLEKSEGDYLFWAADANYSMALIADYNNQEDKARQLYEKSESLYEQSYQGQYDNIYMDFLRNASLFYADHGDYQKAIERANKVYDYLVTVGEGSSIQAFYQLLNIAEINYRTKRYKEAINYSDNALSTINAKLGEGITLLDSVKMEVFKPRAILIHARSEFELNQPKDTLFLKGIAAKLRDALNLLEKRKVMIDDESSINVLITDNQELIDFAKKVELLLYHRTDGASHLEQFINLHESAVYNRIRSRIDKQNAIRFSNLPAAVQEEEQHLKKAMSSSLLANKPTTALMKDYMQAEERWDAHLKKMKIDYPTYYYMRYATIFKPLEDLQQSIADSSTVVRYFMVDSTIYALVADNRQQQLIHLEAPELDLLLRELLQDNTSEQRRLTTLHRLYTELWAPIESHIHSKRVMIIPDGSLYNLSFEMLTTNPIRSYTELQKNCLLAKYTISYHYSLFSMHQPTSTAEVKENYVAFAPGFSDEIKTKYVSTTRDSVNLDFAYLQLLPQPNTNKLAKKIKSMIGGDLFLEENSTQSSFRENAGNHKIIHIGTHAAFNNARPEQSGLVFAKNPSIAGERNFLSLYDLYNCNVRSDLTLLTACESGRPGYQDGEGMISLAHAFNYAGSQRILTALWKIDEQASNQITESFVQFIKDGEATDEALRHAKLEYLGNAKGRVLSPTYWAGLIIMGEPGFLKLDSQRNYTWWIIGSLIAIGIIITIIVKLKNKN